MEWFIEQVHWAILQSYRIELHLVADEISKTVHN